MKCHLSLTLFLVLILVIKNLSINKPNENVNLRGDTESSTETPLKEVKSELKELKPEEKSEDDTQAQTKVSESVSEINTLVELPVSSTTNISYYYPYFYKTKLITFVDEINTSILISSCSDLNCAFCNPSDASQCMKCSTGFFLAGSQCVLYCPEGFISDILRQTCVSVISTYTQVIYSMAYSMGSCKNMCGKITQDCSCAPSCKLRGNCCTDYETVGCDTIVAKAEKVECKNINCQYCDDSQKLSTGVYRCNQCHENYFLQEGQCVSKCSGEFTADIVNSVCDKKPACAVENCDLCQNNNSSVCDTCERGFFKFGNQCLEKCNVGYRADRVTWTCLEPPGKI